MGYIGERDTTKIILEGLAKHEYRGYDSAGIAVIKEGTIHELRTTGRVQHLAEKVSAENFNGDFGIGGLPTEGSPKTMPTRTSAATRGSSWSITA